MKDPEFSPKCKVCTRENKYCRHRKGAPTVWRCLECNAGAICRSSGRASTKAGGHCYSTGHDTETYPSSLSFQELMERYGTEKDMGKIKLERYFT